MLWRKYGIRIEDKEAMWSAQEGICVICPEQIDVNTSHVDHNHETGKVRGLLCNRCNMGLGLFQDSFEILLSASEYLQKHL